MNITYNELANYNNGRLVYKTFNLDGVSREDHYTELTEWLDSLPPVHGCACEEWNVADVEGVNSAFVGDYGIDDDFFKLMEIVDNSYHSLEVFQAGIDCGFSIEDIEDRYQGEHDDDETFAQQYADDCGVEIGVSWPHNCIDWEYAARELMNDFTSASNHYFHNG